MNIARIDGRLKRLNIWCCMRGLELHCIVDKNTTMMQRNSGDSVLLVCELVVLWSVLFVNVFLLLITVTMPVYHSSKRSLAKEDVAVSQFLMFVVFAANHTTAVFLMPLWFADGKFWLLCFHVTAVLNAPPALSSCFSPELLDTVVSDDVIALYDGFQPENQMQLKLLCSR